MIRIAVIGDSHLSALKLAWNEIAQNYPNIEIIFFGAYAQHLAALKEQNGCLIATNETLKALLRFTSGGLDKIEIANFDVVLVHGLGCGKIFFTIVQTVFANYQLYSPATELHSKLISTHCFTQLFEDKLQNSLMFKIVRLVRNCTDIPVFAFPAPFRSQIALSNAPEKWHFLEFNNSQIIKNCYYQSLFRLCQKFNVDFFPQPESTIANDIFSKLIHSGDFISLASDTNLASQKIDGVHMNKEFGKEIFVSFFNVIKNR